MNSKIQNEVLSGYMQEKKFFNLIRISDLSDNFSIRCWFTYGLMINFPDPEPRDLTVGTAFLQFGKNSVGSDMIFSEDNQQCAAKAVITNYMERRFFISISL